MKACYLSFQLKNNIILVPVKTLRLLGSPKYICILAEKNGEQLAVVPYEKKSFHSHRVSKSVYEGNGTMRISSYPLCKMIAALSNWNSEYSYRVPACAVEEGKYAVFTLSEAYKTVSTHV